jgi:hypothetical protein
VVNETGHRVAWPRMARHRETFRGHRLLFSLPILVSVAFAAWFALGAAQVYRSTARLWVDNGPAAGSSLYTMAASTAAAAQGTSAAAAQGTSAEAAQGTSAESEGPADFEQSVVSEQLATPAFDLAVGRDSLLPRFLASGVRPGFSPSVLLGSGSGSIPYQIAQSVATQVTTSIPGPQVLQLAYTGPSAVVARSVLASLVSHLEAAPPTYGNDFVKAEQIFFQQAARDATRAAANAVASAAAYKRDHPDASARTDPTYEGLLASVKTTRATLAAASAAAASTSRGPGAGLKPVIMTIDPPSLPGGATMARSQAALGLLGGLFAGLIFSFLAVLLATPDRRRWDAELSKARWTRLTWDSPRRSRRRGTGHVAGRRPDRGVA